MLIENEALSFTEEAEVRMQDLAEFLARDTRVNLALTSQLHENDMLLTPGAFLMLAIPMLEAARLHEAGGDGLRGKGRDVQAPDVVRESVGRLLATMKAEPAPSDARLDASDVNRIVIERKASLFHPWTRPTRLGPRNAIRSSLSVIQAYWKRFREIPPFAGTGTMD